MHQDTLAEMAYAPLRIFPLVIVPGVVECQHTDSTDYSQSYTAASFVSYYAQRISNNIVMYGADRFLKQLGKVIKTRAKGRNRASSI